MKKWKPKLDESFYFINSTIEITWKYFSPYQEHTDLLIRAGNCFRTRKEAEQKLKEIKLILKSDK